MRFLFPLALAMIIANCSTGNGPTGVTGTASPSIKIVNPTSGATISGQAYAVTIEVEHCTSCTAVAGFDGQPEILYSGPAQSFSLNTTLATNTQHILIVSLKNSKSELVATSSVTVIVSNISTVHETTYVTLPNDKTNTLLNCGANSWKPAPTAPAVGLGFYGIRNNEWYCPFVDKDSGQAALGYTVPPILTITKAAIVTISAEVVLKGTNWKLSEANLYLQRIDSGAKVSQAAVINMVDLANHGGSLTLPPGSNGHPGLGDPPTHQGYLIIPTLIFRYRPCSGPDGSSVTVKNFTLTFSFNDGTQPKTFFIPINTINAPCP